MALRENLQDVRFGEGSLTQRDGVSGSMQMLALQQVVGLFLELQGVPRVLQLREQPPQVGVGSVPHATLSTAAFFHLPVAPPHAAGWELQAWDGARQRLSAGTSSAEAFGCTIEHDNKKC